MDSSSPYKLGSGSGPAARLALTLALGLCSAACAATPHLEIQDGAGAPEPAALGSEPAVEFDPAPQPTPAAPYEHVVRASEHVEGWTSRGPVELALSCCLRGLDNMLFDPTPPPPPVAPLPTFHEPPVEPRRDWYVGAGAGWTSSGLSSGDLADDLAGFGNDALVSLDDTHGGIKLFAGRRLDERWTVEFGYTGLEGHDSEVLEAGPPDPGLADDVAAAHPVTGEGIAVAVRATAFERAGLSVCVRAGLWAWRSDLEVNLNDSRLVIEDDGLDLFFGLGLQYQATDRTALRLEWEQYLLDDDEVHLFTLGFHYEL
ncbi:MAG: outer membrane beta-barrel protein [Planctomycetota bacterium]|jgi:hypothetical protein|nr:outer membrane beta-barrel protein [Planctomycetota bacterium]MDP6989211.1 outer membrane beta-barrel protein [Planctomycetota bacterium]